MRVNNSSLQWKQRSGPFATYAGRSPSAVLTSTTGTPIWRATSWARPRSSTARLGETPSRPTTRPGPRHARRQGEQHRGVDAAGEGHAEPIDTSELGRDRSLGAGEEFVHGERFMPSR